mgnify:CR=1 FL=1
MFLLQRPTRTVGGSFPRMRGDVPSEQHWSQFEIRFSPHARGCSFVPLLFKLFVLVFPACAGMFLKRVSGFTKRLSFPRMRGDVPVTMFLKPSVPSFSPHARGCSGYHGMKHQDSSVFPACAGMFLTGEEHTATTPSFPRMRGDVPGVSGQLPDVSGFSPHARGCSWYASASRHPLRVFPTCAGMFLWEATALAEVLSFPRMRGDVPPLGLRQLFSKRFSPHARGCSPAPGRWNPTGLVFPACAGMFPRVHGLHAGDKRFPRMRRGCSQRPDDIVRFLAVFPACAGMFRNTTRPKRHLRRFPRIRGDVPINHLQFWGPAEFSPHTRGCSDYIHHPSMGTSGFPRARGDVPLQKQLAEATTKFSPYTRGCSGCRGAAQCQDLVFPAYAGIFQRQGLQ